MCYQEKVPLFFHGVTHCANSKLHYIVVWVRVIIRSAVYTIKRKSNQRNRKKNLHAAYESIAYDLVKTELRESLAEDCTGRAWELAIWLVASSASACVTPTILFSMIISVGRHKRNRRKMKPFWFFRLRFSWAYDANDSDYASYSVASENQLLFFQLKSINDEMSFLVLENDLLKDHMFDSHVYVHPRQKVSVLQSKC